MAENEVHKFELKKHADYPEEFKVLSEYVRDIQFGSVTIQIENGRIIQMDKNEKFRFDKHKKEGHV